MNIFKSRFVYAIRSFNFFTNKNRDIIIYVYEVNKIIYKKYLMYCALHIENYFVILFLIIYNNRRKKLIIFQHILYTLIYV